MVSITRHPGIVQGAVQSLRSRARLRRQTLVTPPLSICDRNGNNLLMIAPNNHLPFRRGPLYVDLGQNHIRSKIKLEITEGSREDEEDRENRGKGRDGSKD